MESMLKKGSMGEDVKKLQKMLKDFGYYSGNIDGVFGEKTEMAVRKIQRQTGLMMDGIVGKNTWAMLNNVYIQANSNNSYEDNSNGFLSYGIKQGDTLWDLARSYDTTVECIMIENKLNSTILEEGQNLIIPVGKTACALDIDSIKVPNIEVKKNKSYEKSVKEMNRYSVVYGDSLWKIASRFGMTVEELKEFNGLKKDSLSIGQILRISQ